MTLRIALGTFIALIVALLIALYVGKLERYQRWESVPPQPEARADPYLALARWLELARIPLERGLGLQRVTGVNAGFLVILPAPRGRISPARQRAILAAVRKGQHLLIESEVIDAHDPLLEDAFGMTRTALDEDIEFEASNYWQQRLRPLDRKAPELVRYRDGARKLRVWLRGGDYFERDSEVVWRMNDAHGSRAMQFRYGEGLVTVVNDISFLHNNLLARNDNAAFFWAVLQQTQALKSVLLVEHNVGLWDWLKLYAWRILCSLLILILGWLWYLAPRFGPLRSDPEPVRRRLLDHLRASGRLLWRLGARAELASASRNAALARIKHVYPHTSLLTPEAMVAFAQQRFALGAEQARLLTGLQVASDQQRFQALIAASARVHAVLHHKDRSDPLYHATEPHLTEPPK